MSILGIFDESVCYPAGIVDDRNSTSATGIDTTFVRSGLVGTGGGFASGDYIYLSDLVSFDPLTGDLWLHFETILDGTKGNNNDQSTHLYLLDQNQNPLVRFYTNNTGNFDYSCFAYVTIWDSAQVATSHELVQHKGGRVMTTWDVKIDVTNQQLTVYRGGVQYYTSSEAKLASWTAIQVSHVALRKSADNRADPFTQIIVADEPTLGWKLAQFYPTTEGTHTDGIALAANISEDGLETLTPNEIDSAGQIQTFGCSNLPDLASLNLVVKDVFIGTIGHAASDAASTTLHNQIYTNGALYDAGDATSILDSNYGAPVITRLSVNPATGLPFTEQEINNLEIGYKGV